MTAPQDPTSMPKPASAYTCRANAAQAARLDFADAACFEEAQRGFIGSIPDARITAPGGRVLWDLSAFAFLENIESPDSVHPSLWRQARLNRIHGLFQVCERMYQVRGFDIANITLIEGDTGLILIDPLTVCEAAAAALALYRQHRGDRPVHTVIYSHSHADHYGGVEGVVTPEQVASGKVQVIAPAGFMDAAIAENVLAGIPMRRRGLFQRAGNECLLMLQRRGYRRVLAEARPTNTGSIKGMENQGMRRIRHLMGWIIFERVVVQRDMQNAGPWQILLR